MACASTELVLRDGIEPPTPGLQPGALPAELPEHAGTCRGSRTRTLGFKRALLCLRARQVWWRHRGSNPGCQAEHLIAYPLADSALEAGSGDDPPYTVLQTVACPTGSPALVHPQRFEL
jgi:hypothetical protein